MGRAHAPPAAMRSRRASPRLPWPSFALVAFAAFFSAPASAADDGSIPVSLATRDAVATRADTYTYASVAMPDADHYIHRFEPRASAKVVHHMLLFGCSGAASPTLRAREGGMFSAGGGGQPRSVVCAGDDSEPVIFSWGKDAPDLHLPDGIGFHVGGGDGFRTLVLETHYLETFAGPAGSAATSGVTVHLKPGVPKRSMSVLAYAKNFVLPPRQRRTEVKTVCSYVDSAPLAAYAFRVHTHALGTEVVLEKAVAGRGFEPEAEAEATASRSKPFRPAPIKLASRDPQLPQLFEVLADAGAGEKQKNESARGFDVAPGDALRVTCVFDTSTRASPTRAGWGHGDEMCNLYLMVHAEEPRYASCSGTATGAGGRSKFAFERASATASGATKNAVAARPVGAFVVPPPREPPNARRAAAPRSWPASIGHVSGVAFEPDGRHVWVFHRGSRVWRSDAFDADFVTTHAAPIAEHTVARICLTSGTITRQFGANEHYMPHGLTLAPNGDVWVTDAGAHVVIRYDATTGRRVATFGGAGRSGETTTPPRPSRRARGDFSADADPSGFCMPTDVAVAQDGSFWVSDGYCNDRVARFDADGAFVDEWGAARGARGDDETGTETETETAGEDRAGSGLGFDVPHSITLDFRRARLLVADRERARVTEHDLDGALLRAHDFGEHGYAYHVATLSAEDDGMSGFYALMRSRGDDTFGDGTSPDATAAGTGTSRLLAVWDDGNTDSRSTRLARWDLPFARVPHAIDVVGGGVGGTRAWGRGVSLFVTETGDRERGVASLHRVWLGERFDARRDAVVPPRGWTRDAARRADLLESNLGLREDRASRLYALCGAGTLFITALAFATSPRRAKTGRGRVLEGRRDSRAREEPRRAGVEMT